MNPFAFIEEIREMNENLSDKLDAILDQLILLTEIAASTQEVLYVKDDLYGDGK